MIAALVGVSVAPEPSTLAEWLKEMIRIRRIQSEKELSRRVDISPDTINRIVHGHPTGMDTLDKLAAWAGVPVERLVSIMPRKRKAKPRPAMRLPVYARISAGQPVGVPSGEQLFDPPGGDTNPDRWLCFEISGDCLADEIQHGDRVIVDKVAEPVAGDTVVVDHEGELLVKRVASSKKGLVLVANDGIRIVPNGDTIVVGVAVQVIKAIGRGKG